MKKSLSTFELAIVDCGAGEVCWLALSSAGSGSLEGSTRAEQPRTASTKIITRSSLTPQTQPLTVKSVLHPISSQRLSTRESQESRLARSSLHDPQV